MIKCGASEEGETGIGEGSVPRLIEEGVVNA